MNSAVRCFIMDCSDPSTESDCSEIELSDCRKCLGTEQKTFRDLQKQTRKVERKTQIYGQDEDQQQKTSNDSVEKKARGAKKKQGYRQTYRAKWESEPCFKGWLRAVPGQPTRAYCLYCDRTLHAHFLSLLKHTCTLKHTKAAQIASAKEDVTDSCSENSEVSQKDTTVVLNINKRDGIGKITNTAVIDENLHSSFSENFAPPNETSQTDMTSQGLKCGISTHILDTAKGCTVSGLHVSLYKLIDGKWTLASEGFTNSDGRYNEFIQHGELTTGRYKLHYDVGRYFEMKQQESFYPFVEIVFDVKNPQEHHHVPLLLSPYGYTTYRGS